MSRLTNRTNEIRLARRHRCADHDEAVTIAKLPHLAFEHGYPTVALVQLLPHRQISKTLGSQKGEQNRTRDGSEGNYIDQVVRGHRQC